MPAIPAIPGADAGGATTGGAVLPFAAFPLAKVPLPAFGTLGAVPLGIVALGVVALEGPGADPFAGTPPHILMPRSSSVVIVAAIGPYIACKS